MLASGAWMVPAFLKPFEGLAQDALPVGERNMVVIQLSGGNDGLNTIVPFGNDIYYRKRPSIAIPAQRVIRLNEMQGLNPALAPLQTLYDNGLMSVINDVGYPNPNRSHFRSMDIWQTASDADKTLSTGWLGRYLDASCAGSADEKPYLAVEVDDTLSLAMKGRKLSGLAVSDPAKLYQTTRDPFFAETAGHPQLGEDNQGYLYKTLIQTRSSAAYIQEKTKKTGVKTAVYPDTAFGRQLKTVSRFIRSGMNTRVYYVSLSGFDTHAGQNNQQGRQLKIYAEAVSAFVQDLKKNGMLDNTLILTFSEFGRRVEQNASNGTDHGTANTILLFGGKLKKAGIYNDAPDLADLDAGDLRFCVDFRQVYATALDSWLGMKPEKILSRPFETLGFI